MLSLSKYSLLILSLVVVTAQPFDICHAEPVEAPAAGLVPRSPLRQA